MHVTLVLDGQTQAGYPAEPVKVPTRVRFGLPPRPDRLEGREDELVELHHRLTRAGGSEASVVANTIHGLGGIGKTALALWFAYAHLDEFSLIWWIDAENPGSIPAQYAQFAQALGHPPDLTPEQAQQVVLDQLHHRDTWLVIFDNAQHRQDLHPYLPRLTDGSGAVLITSRNPAGWRSPLELSVLDTSTVVDWLLDAVGSTDQDSANQLAGLLDGLPLAVVQAAGYCETNSTPLARYLELFQTEQQRLLANPAGIIDTRGTVDTTFALSIEQLQADKAAAPAVALLEFCSYLAPDRIPLSIFTPESLGATTPADIEEAIGRLRRYSLLSRDEDLLYVHRLVQDVTRRRTAHAST
jgi:hypothetical protein